MNAATFRVLSVCIKLLKPRPFQNLLRLSWWEMAFHLDPFITSYLGWTVGSTSSNGLCDHCKSTGPSTKPRKPIRSQILPFHGRPKECCVQKVIESLYKNIDLNLEEDLGLIHFILYFFSSRQMWLSKSVLWVRQLQFCCVPFPWSSEGICALHGCHPHFTYLFVCLFVFLLAVICFAWCPLYCDIAPSQFTRRKCPFGTMNTCNYTSKMERVSKAFSCWTHSRSFSFVSGPYRKYQRLTWILLQYCFKSYQKRLNDSIIPGIFCFKPSKISPPKLFFLLNHKYKFPAPLIITQLIYLLPSKWYKLLNLDLDFKIRQE